MAQQLRLSIEETFKSWGTILSIEYIITWLKPYLFSTQKKSKKIALILAGNIPMVGFHDIISVWVCEHKALVKCASKDLFLLPYMTDFLTSETGEDFITYETGKLIGFDAVIATGSNNAARYFDHYFSSYSGVRWIELRNSSGTDWEIYQEGTYAPADGHSRFMGSAAIDAAGNIGLGFNIASPTLPAGIRYTGRFDGDALGEMTITETTIVDGIGVQTFTNRFGDYSQGRSRRERATSRRMAGLLWFAIAGATEVEVKERKDRVDDAMHATRAAVEEGVIPGGGAALIYAGKALEKLNPTNDDQAVGVNIVRKAIQAPARQIAENAGEDGSVIVGKMLESKDTNWGFDAQEGKFTDLVKAGIIDPTKVTRLALENAAFCCILVDHNRSYGC